MKYDNFENGDAADDRSLLEHKSRSNRERPKVKSTWSNRDILKLISLVKKEVCIWDLAHANNSSKQLRKDAWLRVTTQFDGQYDDSEVHAKWSNLRMQYRKNQLKTKSPWRFFETLSFIESKNITPKKKSLPSMCHSSIEDSTDSALDVLSISGSGTSQSTLPKSSDEAHSATASTARMSADVSSQNGKLFFHSSDRDEALAAFLLSELRSLSEEDAQILRCRLQRTLLEFHEARQHNIASDAIDHIDLKFNSC